MALNAAEIPELDFRGLRRFGLTTGGIVALLFGILLPWLFGASWPVWPWTVFAVLAAWALLAPRTLKPLYRGWMLAGMLLGRVTTPIILTLVYFVVFVPAALVMRLLRKDPLHRSFEQVDTYRTKSTNPSGKNMEKPY